MKEVALYDAKNNLSALIAEVEQSGEEIVITRHGKAAAKLAPIAPPAMTSADAVSGLLRIQQRIDERGTDAAPLSWETLKRWGRDEEDDQD